MVAAVGQRTESYDNGLSQRKDLGFKGITSADKG